MGKSRYSARELLRVLCCAFLTGVGCFLVHTIRNGGFFTLNTDFNLQQIPFTMALHNALREGNPGGWIWNYDLGGSIIQSFSFYEMGSPFFWLTMPFSPEAFPYLLPVIYVLKYMTAACTGYLYLTRMVKKPGSAAVGAILYAFSGFQAVNLMFYHFHDVVAFFPLMLLGIEKAHDDPKRIGFFAMATAVNCLVNYFFFIQNVIFCVIYFFFRFGSRRNRKEVWKPLLRCALGGIWGVCMAAVLFLPSALYIAGSSRAGWVPLPPYTWPRFTLYVLRGMLYPGEPMTGQSSLYAGNNALQWSSVGCWLPMVGMTLMIAYIRGRKDRLTGILALLLILSVSPLLASGFYLFSAWYYRWWYFLVMMSALASARVLDDPERYPVRSGTVFSMIAVTVLYLVIRFVPGFVEDTTLVYEPVKLLIFAGIAFAGVLLTELLRRQGKLASRWMLTGICVFAALTTALTTGYYADREDQDDVRREILLGTKLGVENPQYRYAQGSNILNLCGRAAGTSIFSSTVSAGSWEFDELFDYRHAAVDYGKIVRTVIQTLREEGLDMDQLKDAVADQTDTVTNRSLDKAFTPGLYELFGGRYHVSWTKPEKPVLREISVENKTAYVWEEEACPIGFAVQGYMLEEDLLALDRNLRGAALLRAAVIRPEDEEKLKALIPRTYGKDATPESIPESVRISQENSVIDFERDTRGFRCVTAFESPQAVWFSVPFDPGWTAEIDGMEADVIHSGGMMLLPVPAGEHSIRFTYETPGWRAGVWISLVSLAAWALWEILIRIRRRQ